LKNLRHHTFVLRLSAPIKDKKKSTPRRHHKSSTTNNGKNLDSGEPEERSGESAGTSARESESEAAPLSLQRPHSIPGEAGASSLGACSLQQVILNLGVCNYVYNKSDVFGHFWLFLAIFGHFWPFLAIFGHFWPFLAIFGHFLTYLLKWRA
jgi:hypothetical protein